MERPKLNRDEIDEQCNYYLSAGWIPLVGMFTIGFISPCGELFDCFDAVCGHSYSFSTEWALWTTIEAKKGKTMDS